MSLFDYVASLGPVLHTPLQLGSVRKIGTYGGAGTISNTPSWRRLQKGFGFFTGNNSALVYVDSGAAPELRLSAGTLFYVSPGMRLSTAAEIAQRIVSKRDGGGTAYELQVGTLGFNFAGSIINYDPAGKKTCAVRFADGEDADYFFDGTHIGTGTPACTISSNDADFWVGNLFNGARPLQSPLNYLVLFPSQLSDEQISDLHALWLQSARVGPGPKRPKWFVKEDLTRSPVLHIASFDNPTDLSGNGNDGTKSGVITRAGGVYGDALDFHGQGAGIVTVADDANLQDIRNLTFAAWSSIRGLGEVQGRIAEKGPWDVLILSNRIYYFRLYSVTNGSWYVDITYGREHHVAISHDVNDTTTPPIIYLDGEPQSVTEALTPDGTPTTDVGSDVTVGNVSTGIRTFDGWIDDVRLYDSILTPAQIRDIYLEGATKPRILSPRYEHPVSLADESAQAGPWQVGSGTFQWTDDGDRRGLDCITSGWAATPSAQAFGGWYFRATKSDTSAFEFPFIASDRDGRSGSNQNGYSVFLSADERVQLLRFINGSYVGGFVFGTGPDYIPGGVEYEFYVSRRPVDSLFAIYIRGGSYTDWTLVGTGTDTTHTTSAFVIADISADDRISDLRFFPYGGTIDPTEGDLDGLLLAA